MWAPLRGYEGIYEIRPGADGGRIRRVQKLARTSVGRELGDSRCGMGYPRVVLSKPGERPRYVRLHTLILETFVGPKPAGCEGCHRDDVRTNNTLENLYWGSRSQNNHDAIRNGRRVYRAKS
jgi:hypothetical protein